MAEGSLRGLAESPPSYLQEPETLHRNNKKNVIVGCDFYVQNR